MFNGDKATLVWERDVDYNNAATPTAYRNLSDLDLKLYAETTNAQLDSDTTVKDNVHQVAASASQSAVVKVYAYSSSFDGASRVQGPGFDFPSCTPRPAASMAVRRVAKRGSAVTTSSMVRNSGTITASMT